MHESKHTVIQNARTVVLKKEGAQANITEVLLAWQAPSAAAVQLRQVSPTLVKQKT
jgi:hypothetical protein